jgi:acetyl esterase/lipase
VRSPTAVVYARYPGYRPLELDLFLPSEGSGPHPALVFFHGGGWRLGSRRSVATTLDDRQPSVFETMTEGGLAVVSIDYRLSGEARWPAQRADTDAALDWVAGPGAEAGIDPGRVVVFGASSGGQLAALAALKRENPVEVRAAICWYPVTDLVALDEDVRAMGGDTRLPGSWDSRESLLLGGRVQERIELARDASPISHVRAGAPPFLLLHGDADIDVPLVQSSRFAEALAAKDNEVSLEVLSGAGHVWQGADARTLDQIVSRTVGYAIDATTHAVRAI